MRCKLSALLFLTILSALLAGCMTLSEFDVHEGPMQNGVRQPLRVQVLVPAKSTDIIVVSWGDGTETTWNGVMYFTHSTNANVQHTYNTQGTYAISVSSNGDPLGTRTVLIKGE